MYTLLVPNLKDSTNINVRVIEGVAMGALIEMTYVTSIILSLVTKEEQATLTMEWLCV